MNADKHWHTYNRFRLRKAKQFEPVIYAALQEQINHYAKNRNIDAIPIQPMYDALKSLYAETGSQWAAYVYKSILRDAKVRPAQTKALPIGFNEDFVNAIFDLFNTELLLTVSSITDTTKDYIRQALTNGIANGEGIDQIVADILANTGISRTRAELISRTEVMKASNGAEQVGTDKTGLQTQKEWLSVRDNRTRHDHITADGQVQPDGKPFTIGLENYQMQRPGDGRETTGLLRAIPAKEIVNCRCTVGRLVLRGENGLPLKREGLVIR